ncbi:MAG: C1 family peptidase [candidate division Zixibacteria bacterium]
MSDRSRFLSVLILTAFICILTIPAMAADKPISAPLPEQYSGQMPEGRGFIAPRLNMSHIVSEKPTLKFATVDVDTIDQFDWRTTGKVTPVKNQSFCGACYSFASLGCFESKVLIDSNVVYDFSENHSKECNYFGTSCGGGNFDYLASLYSIEGTVLESCDPYVASDVACNSTCDIQKVLLDWRIISTTNIPTPSALKSYIYNYGPVYTALYTGDTDDIAWQSEFNIYDGSYTLYYNNLSYSPNHAVLLVGWDDSLSHAGGTGGWIVKNSWGTSWGGTCGFGGESGYFTIAYGSANFGQWSSYVHEWQNYEATETLLYYDEAGATQYWGYSNVTGYGLAGYTPSSDGYLTRVEFWTNDACTDVDVYVYDDFTTGTSNLLASQLDNSYNEPGYHSVLLDSPPALTSGDDIYIVVKLTNVSYGFPIVGDHMSPNESSKTYISSSGLAGSWYEMGINEGCDIAIRGRTSPNLSVDVNDDISPGPVMYSLKQNYPNPFNPSTVFDYTVETRSHVTISIFNILGQPVKTLVDEVKSAGTHSISWDGTNEDGKPMSTGIYFYRITSGDYTETRKMILLK